MSRLSRRRALAGLWMAGAVTAVAAPLPALADQRHMESALDALRAAETHLERARASKGGHRTKALGLVRQAMKEVQRGIAYDRKH